VGEEKLAGILRDAAQESPRGKMKLRKLFRGRATSIFRKRTAPEAIKAPSLFSGKGERS